MTAWYIMPTRSQARKVAASAELEAALDGTRATLLLLRTRLDDPVDRELAAAALDEVCRAAAAAGVLRQGLPC